MNILKQSFFALIAVAMLSVFSVEATAQDRTAAVQAYNSAQELAKSGDYEESIAKFEEAIATAEGLSSEGTDIVERSKKQLPSIYYQKALGDYKASQSAGSVSSLNTAIASFEETVDAGTQYGNSKIADQASGAITQLMYRKSVLQYRAQQFDAAMTTINSVIDRNANYANGYYHKALILKKTSTTEEMLAMLEKAVEVGEANNNSQIARKAQEKAASELIYSGSTMTQNKNYAGAIEQLNKALEYNPESSEAHYRLAEAYNDRGDFSNGLSHGQKALELENGGRSSKAKIYFEIATAHKGNGNFSQACSAFSNAAYGQFKGAAEHEMEFSLKCDNKTN